MVRRLSAREHSVALFMVRHATTSPDEVDYAGFSPEQREVWDPPEPISTERRQLWEGRLSEVVVTNECECGTCPSVGMRPGLRDEDERRDDKGGGGDWTDRVVLTAGTAGAMLLLFIDDNIPSYLELAPIDNIPSFAEFPEPASIIV